MEFIKQKTTEDGVLGVDTALSDVAVYILDCIQLNAREVFIVSTNASNNKLSASLCSIEDTEISAIKTTVITDAYAGMKPCALKISNNKVLIFYFYNDYYRYIPCTITNNEIIIGETTQLVYKRDSTYYIKAFMIGENKAILFYGLSRLIARIITINDDMSLTLGNEVNSNTFLYEYSINFCQLSNNKIIITYMNSNKLTGIICKISNLSITFGTAVQLSAAENSFLGNSIAKITEDKVIIAHANREYNYYLTLTICLIKDTEIIVLSSKQTTDIILHSINNTSYKDYFTSIALLSENYGIVACKAKPNRRIILYTIYDYRR